MTTETHFISGTIRLLLLILLTAILLIYAKEILIPISIAGMLSFLFLPVEKKLTKTGIPEILSILICILLLLIGISGLLFLFYNEVSSFTDQLPQLEDKATTKINLLFSFIENHTGFSSEKQKALTDGWIKKISAGKWVTGAFQSIGSVMLTFGLILVYVFCFLFFKNNIRNAVLATSGAHDDAARLNMIFDIKQVGRKYFSGMLLVMFILGTMHSIGLLILGIPNAIFLGYLAGMFILAPIIGTMVGSSIPFMVALLTKDSGWYALGVAGVFTFNLFMESQVLTPLIVGSNVRLNPMAVILSIVVGGFLWGIPGMVLFIPIAGIFKIVSDHTGYFKPLNILISDNTGKGGNILNKWWKKLRK